MNKKLFLILALISATLVAQITPGGGIQPVRRGGTGVTSFTANAVLLGNGTSPVQSSNLIYTTPNLVTPDAFNISSAGSISLTASGASKNITLTRSSTGAVVVSSGLGGLPAGIDGSVEYLSVAGVMGVNAIGFGPTYYGRRMNGTFASPTAITSGQALLNLVPVGRTATGWSGYPGTAAFTVLSSEAWSDSANGTRVAFGTIRNTTTTSVEHVSILDYGALRYGINGGTTTAWGTTGVVSQTAGSATYTDSSSSGTVATAVANSFAVPTFAASSATVFTNAANLYIAGDAAAGTNVTLTDSYGLWNVGKTRQGGAVIGDVQALSGAGAINVTQPHTDFTSTGGAQVLTLANGILGQEKTIVHVVDGGSGVLTPTTKVGFSTITFTTAGESVTLRYTASGWAVVGSYLATIAP